MPLSPRQKAEFHKALVASRKTDAEMLVELEAMLVTASGSVANVVRNTGRSRRWFYRELRRLNATDMLERVREQVRSRFRFPPTGEK